MPHTFSISLVFSSCYLPLLLLPLPLTLPASHLLPLVSAAPLPACTVPSTLHAALCLTLAIHLLSFCMPQGLTHAGPHAMPLPSAITFYTGGFPSFITTCLSIMNNLPAASHCLLPSLFLLTVNTSALTKRRICTSHCLLSFCLPAPLHFFSACLPVSLCAFCLLCSLLRWTSGKVALKAGGTWTSCYCLLLATA